LSAGIPRVAGRAPFPSWRAKEQKGAMPRKPFGKPTREIDPGTAPGRGGSIAGNGQPPFVPTDAQRQRVMDLVSCNFTQQEISIGLGIPLRTLERHFQDEIENGKVRVHAEIAAGIVEAARQGDKTMRVFYAKSQLGWRDRTLVGLEDGQGGVIEPKVFSIQIGGPREADVAAGDDR
jgi:hypothetical protein